MDPVQATMAGILIAREIMQIIKANKQVSEEQLTVLIASNLIKFQTTIETIKSEMAKYGVEVR